MIYQFKTGYKPKGLDAQAVGEALEAIRIGNGNKLTPADVVVHATSEDSPLHNAFTWDDSEAANLWRQEEARNLVRHVVVLQSEEDAQPVKAFWSVTVKQDDERPETYYQSAAVIHKNPQEYNSALKATLGDLTGAQNSLKQLKQLAPSSERLRVAKASAHVEAAHRVLQPV